MTDQLFIVKKRYQKRWQKVLMTALAIGVLMMPVSETSAITTNLQAPLKEPVKASSDVTTENIGTVAIPLVGAEPFYTMRTGLPESVVKQLGKNTPLVIRDYEKGFQITIPFRLQGITVRDTVSAKSNQGLRTYLGQILTKGRDNLILRVAAEDNQPEDGSSLAEWNSTWYGVPVKGMSKERFLELWKKDMTSEDLKTAVDGDLLTGPEVAMGYWSEMVFPEVNGQTEGNVVKGDAARVTPANFSVNFVLTAKPKMKFMLGADFEHNNLSEARSVMSNKIVPSFNLIADIYRNRGTNSIGKNNKMYSLVVPNGFSFKEIAPARYELRNQNLLWEVGLFDVPTPWSGEDALYMTKVAEVGDAYITNLISEEGTGKADIEGYYYTLDQKEAGFVIYGTMYSETLKKKLPFVSYNRLTHDNVWIVSRVFYPAAGKDALRDATALAEGVRGKI